MLPIEIALAASKGVDDAVGEVLGVDWGVFGDVSGVFGAGCSGVAVDGGVDGDLLVMALVIGELPQLPRTMVMQVQPTHPKRVKTVVSHTERRGRRRFIGLGKEARIGNQSGVITRAEFTQD